MSLDSTTELVFAASCNHIIEPKKVQSDSINWEKFQELAIGTHLAPILHKSLPNSIPIDDIPTSIKSTLSNTYNQVLVRNVVFQQAFRELLSLSSKNQIPLVPLKGIYLSEAIYRDLGLRHLSDIDVLLKTEHLDMVCGLMNNVGWEIESVISHSKFEDEKFAQAHPKTLVKGGIRIELHTHLYSEGQGAKVSAEQLWDDVHMEEFLGFEIYQFSNELLLQHLCLHLDKHMFGSGVKVLSFCDIREFLAARPEFDWKRFEELAERYKCKMQVSQILYLCHKYWGINVPAILRTVSESKVDIESRFWSYVNGDAITVSKVMHSKLNRKSRNLNELDSLGEKVRFLWGFVFPKEEFMRKNYHVAEGDWLLPWYAYRPIELTAQTITAILGRG